MKRFSYIRPNSLNDATQLLEQDDRSRLLAGGTDLIPQIKSGVVVPERLVSIKSIPGLIGISINSRHRVNIGALETLDNIANNTTIIENFPLLVQAISVTASPQLRNRGTIGGNLNQASRCWYYRGDFQCWLKGGEVCYALNGENGHHAIFGISNCHTVHPSDLAPALLTLGASVRIKGTDEERTIALEYLYQIPENNNRQFTVLKPGEIIHSIEIQKSSHNTYGVYLKAMERRTWSLALASAAVAVKIQNKIITEAKLVLGGVAPIPWKLRVVENELINRPLDNKIIEIIADLAVAGARPLSNNSYKTHS